MAVSVWGRVGWGWGDFIFCICILFWPVGRHEWYLYNWHIANGQPVIHKWGMINLIWASSSAQLITVIRQDLLAWDHYFLSVYVMPSAIINLWSPCSIFSTHLQLHAEHFHSLQMHQLFWYTYLRVVLMSIWLLLKVRSLWPQEHVPRIISSCARYWFMPSCAINDDSLLPAPCISFFFASHVVS